MQGLRDNVMVRADEWNFLCLGCFLERADNTLRLLGTMFFHPALQVASDSGQSIDALHLAAVLRMSPPSRPSRGRPRALTLERVIEFLFLDARFPRSVAFAFEQLQRALHALSQTPEDVYTNDAEQSLRPPGRRAPLCQRAGDPPASACARPIDRVLGTVGQIGGAVHRGVLRLMLLELTHETAFRYDRPVSETYMEFRLTPLTDGSQHVIQHRAPAEAGAPRAPGRRRAREHGDLLQPPRAAGTDRGRLRLGGPHLPGHLPRAPASRRSSARRRSRGWSSTTSSSRRR